MGCALSSQFSVLTLLCRLLSHAARKNRNKFAFFACSASSVTFFYYLCYMAKYDDIFLVGSDAEFEREALRLFRHQAERCSPYAEYIRLLGVEPAEVRRVEDIPMLPIELFKSHKLYCGDDEPQKVFTSSATTGMVQSKHYVADLALYERAFMEAFRHFYGEPKECSIYALLYKQPSFKCHFHPFQNVKLFFQYVLNIALVCGTMYAQKYRVSHFCLARTKLPILLQQT